MSNVRSGLLFSFAGKYGLKLINLISTILIARLLTPAEIGTFAIASSVVMLLSEVRLMGATAYLVREELIDELKIRKAYGMTFLMCWGIALVLILGSEVIADFFNHHDLQVVFIILASSFFLAPYISIPNAILARNYQFKQITIISLISVIIQLLVTISLITADYSYYSLAWGHFAAMLTQMILSLYLTKHLNILFTPRFRGIGVIAKLGVFTSASNIVRRIHYSVSDIVIGKMGTPTGVAIFSRGMGYVDFVSQSLLDGIGAVATPYMSDMKRRGNDISKAYIKTTVLVCSLLWPVLFIAGLAALPAIRLLFGKQWDDAASIATVLSFWMCIKGVSFFLPSVLIAIGHEVAMFKRDVVLFVLLLISLILSYPQGLTSMAFTFLFNGVVELLITLWLLKTKVNMSIKDFIISITKPFLVAIFCLTIAFFLDYIYPFASGSPLVVFMLLAVIMPPLWLLLTKWLKLQIYMEVTNVFLAASRRLMRKS